MMDCSVEKLVALVPRCGMKPSYPVGAGEAFSLTEVPLLRLSSGVIVNIWENEARSKSRDIISTTHPKTFSRGGAKAGRKRSLNGVTSDRAVHKTFGHSGGGGLGVVSVSTQRRCSTAPGLKEEAAVWNSVTRRHPPTRSACSESLSDSHASSECRHPGLGGGMREGDH